MEILDTASSLENEVSFTDAEVAVVKKALTTKLFRRQAEPIEVRLPKFQLMFTELSEVFGIPEVKIEIDCDRASGHAWFKPESNVVVTEKFLSLVTVLKGFAFALIHHKPELRTEYNEETDLITRKGLHPLAFALSMFKQAAPVMFEDAKTQGRLAGTSVPYDTHRWFPEMHQGEEQDDAPESTGETSAPEGGTTDLPAPPPAQPRIQPPQRPSSGQRPDVDPENRVDRGNGHGED